MADFEPVEIDFLLGGNAATEGKKIEQSLESIAEKSKKAQAQVSSVGKNVNGFTNLSFSVQQVVRELPSATLGLNMFFLAISNNVPMLVDNIKRARVETEAMKAAGQASTPVWKQLIGSLVSWQTLMIVGITLVTLFGKEIANAFTKGSAAASRAKEDAKKFNEAFASSVADPIAKVNKLAGEWNSLGENMDKKKKFVDENKSAFRELGVEVNNVRDAENLLVDNVDNFRQAMIAKAMSVASMQVATEKYQEYFKKMRDAEKMSDTVTVSTASGGQSITGGGTMSQTAVKNRTKENAKKLAESIRKEGDSLIASSNEQDALYQSIMDNAGIRSAKTAEKAEKANKKAREKEYNSEKDFQALMLDLNKETWDLLAEQVPDGVQKKMDALSVAEEQELQKIRESQQKIVDEYNKAGEGKKGFKKASTLADVDPEQAKKVQEQVVNLQAAYAKWRAGIQSDYYKDLKKKAEISSDELLRIDHDYEDKIAELRKAGLEDYARALEAQRDREKSAVTVKLIEETDLYRLATSQQLDISMQLTNRLIADIEARLKAELAANKITVDDYNAMAGKINKARGKLSTNTDNPFTNLGNAITNAGNANDAYKAALADPKATTEQLVALQDAANKANGEVSDLSMSAISGIQGMLNQVIDGLDSLGVFTEQEKKDAEDIVGMVGGAANLAMGIASGNPMQIIQGSLDLITSAISFFDFKSKGIAKRQKEHEENIADLERAYNKLQRAVENALGTDVYATQRASIENSKQQIAEYEAWIAEEKKKKKKKQDQDAIKDKQDKIQELKNSIEDEVKAISESLAQTNAKSLAGELADAITTAFADGENAATAFGDVAEQVMQNAVKNALKLQFLEKPMQNAVDQLAKDMESGGELTGTEQSAFRKKIEDAGKLYYEQLAQYSDLFTGQNSQTGIKGDVANMSEKTGSALTGQVIAMRLNVSAILANSKSSLDAVGKVLVALERIKDNTDRLVRIDETLNYIRVNGIKVQ